MATNEHGHNYGHTNPEVSFEISDLSARGILVFFAVLAIGAIMVHFVVYGLYKGYAAYAAKSDPEVSPLAKYEPPPQASVLQNTSSVNLNKFGGVLLQSDDVHDMQVFLEVQNAQLYAQPWRDEKGNIHLPIDAAMQRVIADGRLQARPGNAPSEQTYPGVGSAYSGIPELYKIQSSEEPQAEGGAPRELATPPTKIPESTPSESAPEKVEVPK
ncbi:MAG TPA: hypothetical protein VMU24_06365 [Candidatus Acidoferrales bacterium]|nr:hypothetical protein [Candidatus Acidoferrales bacterium]